MTPSCWCKNHDLERRAIHEMYEVDPEQNEVSGTEHNRGRS